MSGRNRFSIKVKLFLVILAILGLNVVVLVFMGSTLFESLYLSNKVGEIKSGAKLIKENYNIDNEAMFDNIFKLENKNITISILEPIGDGLYFPTYHSRQRGRENYGDTTDGQQDNGNGGSPQGTNQKKNDSLMPEKINKEDGQANPDPMTQQPPDNQLPDSDKQGQPSGGGTILVSPFHLYVQNYKPEFDAELLKRVLTSDEEFVMNDYTRANSSVIRMATQMGDGVLLYIETPLGLIRSTARLAVQYTAFLAIGILLVGSVFIYFVLGRLTKPIRSMQVIADKISNLDFSQKCSYTGKDEIGALSESINHMSEELQENYNKLLSANEVLQNDLIRQQKTDQMRKEFIASVSHDFKTPLTLILSYAETMMEQKEFDSQFCEIILDEGKKMTHMVQQLLKLSQLESGMNKLEKNIFCINEIIDAVVRNSSILIQNNALDVRTGIHDNFIVNADYHKIDQVISNLFGNALKYAPPGSIVEITTQQADAAHCQVSVYNSGSHIPDEDLENIFVSFYKSDKARKRDGQSYGLGLAIVKVIMELHEQNFGVENTEDGVRFWFELETVHFDDPEEEDELETPAE